MYYWNHAQLVAFFYNAKRTTTSSLAFPCVCAVSATQTHLQTYNFLGCAAILPPGWCRAAAWVGACLDPLPHPTPLFHPDLSGLVATCQSLRQRPSWLDQPLSSSASREYTDTFTNTDCCNHLWWVSQHVPVNNSDQKVYCYTMEWLMACFCLELIQKYQIILPGTGFEWHS